MSEATVIVETGVKGGSIVTASLASGYNREVFAFPGRTTDTRSSGCHALIRQNRAALVTTGADIADHLNWESPAGASNPRALFEAGSPEGLIHELLLQNGSGLHLDELIARTGLSAMELAAPLLTMELEQVVKSLPGMRYRLAP